MMGPNGSKMGSILPARRRRQTLIVVFVFVVLCYITYTRSFTTFSAPDHENHTHPPPSPTLRTPEHLPAEYGTTARPPFKDLILQADLPAKHLPKLSTDGNTEKHEGNRLIFIGDVHGMLDPLKNLLQELKFDAAAGDHVVFTGDMIMKGPDSVGVIDYAMEIGASAVRGNHEDRVLLAAQQLDLERRRRKHQKTKQKGSEKKEVPKDDPDEDYQYALTDTMEEEHFSHGDNKDRTVARHLTSHQLTWLASLPVILKIGHLPPMGDVVAVHAGLVPGIPLEKQDPWAVMNMRTLLYLGDELRVEFARQAVESARRDQEPDEDMKERINVGPKETEVLDLAMRDRKEWDNDVFVPVASRDGERWTKVWEKEMKQLAKKVHKSSPDDGNVATAPKTDRLMSVVFGHDSKRGLQLGKYSYGIDSGCVRGGQLSALVVQASANGKKVETQMVGVECRTAGRAAENEDDF